MRHHNALDVITNADLLKHITSYSNGLAWIVLRFKRDCQLNSTSNNDLLNLAIHKDEISLAKRLHNDEPWMWNYVTLKEMENTVARGNLELVEWMCRTKHSLLSHRMMEVAARFGHLEIIKCLHAYSAPVLCSKTVLEQACLYGHLDILSFLHKNCPDFICTQYAMDFAARKGHLSIVQYLLEHQMNGCVYTALQFAAEHQRLQVVEYLAGNLGDNSLAYEKLMRIFTRACTYGRIDVVLALLRSRVNEVEYAQAFQLAIEISHAHDNSCLLQQLQNASLYTRVSTNS